MGASGWRGSGLMLAVQPNCTSAQAYAGTRLLIDLYEAGVGLREAVQALEPVAEAMWNLIQQQAAGDEREYLTAKLRVDPSVSVTCRNADLLEEMECMLLRIERHGRFKIKLHCSVPDGGGLAPFSLASPSIAMDAEDPGELATFLTLVKLGGDLDEDYCPIPGV